MRNKLCLKHLLLIGGISLTEAHATDDIISAENLLTGMITDPLSRNSQMYSDVLNRVKALPFDKVTDFRSAATRICSPDKPGHNLIILDGLIKLDSEVLSDDRYISIIQSLLDVTSCESQRIFVFNILKVLQREQWEPFQKITSFLFGLRGSNEYYVNWTEIFNSIGLDTLCDPRFLSILQKLNEPRMGMCMGVLDAKSAIQSIAKITLDKYDRLERDVLNHFSAGWHNNMFRKVDLIKYLINFSLDILYDMRLIGVLNGVFSLEFAYLEVFSALAKMDSNKLFDPRFVPTLKLRLQQSYCSYNLLRNGTDYYDYDQLRPRIISAIEALNDIDPEQWDELPS